MLRKMVKASVVLIIASLGIIAYSSDNDNGKAAASYSQKKHLRLTMEPPKPQKSSLINILLQKTLING